MRVASYNVVTSNHVRRPWSLLVKIAQSDKALAVNDKLQIKALAVLSSCAIEKYLTEISPVW